MNAADLAPGMTVIEYHRIGRTHALGLYPVTLATVTHTGQATHYQLIDTGDVRTVATDAELLTVLPHDTIEIVYLPARGTTHIVAITPTRATFQALVGRDLQRLPLAGATLTLHRDARDFDGHYNPIASRLAQIDRRRPAIYGHAVLHGPPAGDGRPTSVPAGYLARLDHLGTPS